MIAPLIQLRDITIAYGTTTVVDSFSIDIHAGDFMVFRGKNGGGKTSLLKAIVGLLPPTRGTIVRADGLTMGYLPQYRSIDRQFPITVEQTVLSGTQTQLPWWRPFGQAQRAATAQQLQQLHLAELAHRPIDTLSGGQWQRTLLARALVSNPQLLILDEPDTHLDAASKEELHQTLLSEHARRTILLVSHDNPPLPPDARIVEVG